MLQARHDLRLATEPLARIGIGQQVAAHDLDRDVALEPHVPCAKHRAHAALSDDGIDAVLVVDDGADGDRGTTDGAAGHQHRRRMGLGRAADYLRRADLLPEARQVEGHAHLHRDAAQQLAIFGRVRFFRSLGTERDQPDERPRVAAARENRHQQRGVGPGQPAAIGRRHARHRRLVVIQEHLQRLVRPAEQGDDAAVGTQGSSTDAERRNRLEHAAQLGAGRGVGRTRFGAREHRHAFGMQRRVDLAHDHRQQVARVGLVRDAAGERHQDLARVVFGAEEVLVEPPLRGDAVAQAEAKQRQADQVEQRPPAHDHRQRHVALLHQRGHQRDHRQDDQHRQRAPREGVLQAAAQHGARAEDVPDRDRVGQAERRQQHDRLQQRLEQPGQFHRAPEQSEQQGNAGLQRVGEHRRHAGEDHDLDAPPLVGVGVLPVAANAFNDDQHVGGEADREAGIERPCPFGQPRQRRQHGVGAEQERRAEDADDEHRRRGGQHRRHDPAMPVENLGPVREVDHREADDRERQGRDDPVEDQQQWTQQGHPLRAAEQRTGVGRGGDDQCQRHQHGRGAARAERQQHRRAGEEGGDLRQRPEMQAQPRAPRRAVHRPDGRLFQHRLARRPIGAGNTECEGRARPQLLHLAPRAQDVGRGGRQEADDVTGADAGAIGGAARPDARHGNRLAGGPAHVGRANDRNRPGLGERGHDGFAGNREPGAGGPQVRA